MKPFCPAGLAPVWIMAGIGLLLGAQGLQAAVPIAVARFDYADTSGEKQDETAVHAARLDALSRHIEHDLAASGRYQAEALKCDVPSCSAASLDQNDMMRAAREQHVRFLVFGGVHKMSTLIQWGRVEVMDVRSGGTAMSRTISFRGDDEAAWQHAGGYIAKMLLEQLR